MSSLFLMAECPDHGATRTSEETAVLELDPVFNENRVHLWCEAGDHELDLSPDDAAVALILTETETLTIMKEYA